MFEARFLLTFLWVYNQIYQLSKFTPWRNWAGSEISKPMSTKDNLKLYGNPVLCININWGKLKAISPEVHFRSRCSIGHPVQSSAHPNDELTYKWRGGINSSRLVFLQGLEYQDSDQIDLLTLKSTQKFLKLLVIFAEKLYTQSVKVQGIKAVNFLYRIA